MSTTSNSTAQASEKLYFGYGSNLWLQQMRSRCPNSQLIGLSRLSGFKWIINDRGYANVIETRSKSDKVWGLVFSLPPDDEARLDINEGVPVSYTKEMIEADLWLVEANGDLIEKRHAPELKQVLVYIDRERLEPDQPKAEYIVRLNYGIIDAVRLGMPESYVKDVLRKYIPQSENEDPEIRRKAELQAREFRDENE